MQFCLAVALIDGPPQIQHFTGQWINDQRIRQLLPRISLLSEPTFSVPSGADAIPAKVRIVLSDGRIFDKTVMEPYGDPRRPLTMELRKSKFKECTLDMMTKSQATLTWDYLNTLDQQSNIAELFPLTFPNN
jgi:2-methylcitrate dehydratase PrpD